MRDHRPSALFRAPAHDFVGGDREQTEDDAGRQAGYGASSRHSGGVNVLFCDGSVRFVKETIAPQNWWALGTRNNAEIVSSDAY